MGLLALIRRLFAKDWVPCPECGGWGSVDRGHRLHDGAAVIYKDECPRCGGRGLVRK
jgi:DnaJ-class molecular chaperone